MRLILLALLSLGLLAAVPARSATKQEKIHELIEITDVSNQMESTLESLWPVIIDQGRRANPDMPAEIWERVRALGREEFSKSLPEVLAQFERMYDIGFTEAEIDALLTFYKTPLGASVMRKLNDMAPQIAALGQAWGGRVGQRVRARLSEEMRKKGYEMRL